MDSVSEIEKMYNIGLPILKKINEMSDVEIKAFFTKLVGEDNTAYAEFNKINSTIERLVKNEVISKITIYFDDSIEITPFGISFIPKHGDGSEIKNFNEFFTF